MKKKKYEILYNDTIEIDNRPLYRIKALKNIKKHSVKKGDLGGYIESEKNLSQDGDCWIGEECVAFENAQIIENAFISGSRSYVCGNAVIKGNARISSSAIHGNAIVQDDAEVILGAMIKGNAIISEQSRISHAKISGNARIQNHAFVVGDVIVYGNAVIRDNAKVTAIELELTDNPFKHTTLSIEVKDDTLIGGNANIHHPSSFMLELSGKTVIQDTKDIFLAAGFLTNLGQGEIISFVRDSDKGIVGGYRTFANYLTKEEFISGINTRINANKKILRNDFYLPIEEFEIWIKEYFDESDATILLQFCQIAKCKMK